MFHYTYSKFTRSLVSLVKISRDYNALLYIIDIN